jgi:hypothetical protein
MPTGMTKKQKDTYEKSCELFKEINTKPWLAEGMQRHGYDEAALAEGKSLADTAFELARVRADAESIKLGATDTLYEHFDNFWPYFRFAMKTAVALLQGQTEYLDRLGLHEARLNGNGTSQISKPNKNDSLEPTLAWLSDFYDVAQNNPDINAILAFPPDRLAEDAAKVATLIQDNERQDEAMAARKLAVKKRNAAFTRLKVWVDRAVGAADLVKKEHEEEGGDNVEIEL